MGHSKTILIQVDTLNYSLCTHSAQAELLGSVQNEIPCMMSIGRRTAFLENLALWDIMT